MPSGLSPAEAPRRIVRMNTRVIASFLAIIATLPAAVAETVKDREGAVRGDKARMEADPRWNYNAPEAAFDKARTSGRPVLVVLRCIPCLACAGLDAGVIEDASLAPLLDQFECVRVINANALDLSRFQFDYNLSFSALVFNADGTLYARWGSWRHQKDPQDKSTAGLKATLEAALALHRGYPANKVSLAGKQGAPTRWRTPLDFPSLSAKYQAKLDWEGKVVQSCMHCHMIGDAFRTAIRSAGEPMPPEWIWPHPPAETVGLTLAPDSAATVAAVAEGSAAAKAGLKAGDVLHALGGQAVISSADVSWVLHRAAETGALTAEVAREGRKETLRLELAEGWRGKADISRPVGTWSMRAMALGGLKLADVPEDERARLGLAGEAMALRVEHAGEYGIHAAAKNAGFRKGDILTAVGSTTHRVSEGELIGQLLRSHRPGDSLPATVRRGSETLSLRLPQQ